MMEDQKRIGLWFNGLVNTFLAKQKKIHGLVRNFPSRWSRVFLKVMLLPLGRRRQPPSDALGQKLAKILTCENQTRDRLTKYVFLEPSEGNVVAELEDAFRQILAVEPLEKRVAQSVREGEIIGLTLLEQIDEAEKLGILSEEETLQLRNAEMARQRIIAVDDFSFEELGGNSQEKQQGKANKKTKKSDKIKAS